MKTTFNTILTLIISSKKGYNEVWPEPRFGQDVRPLKFGGKFLASLIENSYVESLRPEASKLATSFIE